MKKTIIWAFGLVVVALGGVAIWVHASAPQLSGERTLAGLTAPVTVLRDEFSVPHIYAADKNDAYRALGYVQAEDRLFQLDLMRHVAGGRLAEWFGAPLIERDKKCAPSASPTTRRLGSNATSCRPIFAAAIDAYLGGLNAAAENQRTLEHRMLGISCEPFTRADVLAMVGFMAFGFAEGLSTDPLYADLERSLGPEKMRALVARLHTGRGALR